MKVKVNRSNFSAEDPTVLLKSHLFPCQELIDALSLLLVNNLSSYEKGIDVR